MTHSEAYLSETALTCHLIDFDLVECMAMSLAHLRDTNGRLFIAGLGGSAANASHAANDFKKLCGIEAYCLSDNVAELTARANDDGWNTIYRGSLYLSRAKAPDALLILSVGGGADEVSRPLCEAISYAQLTKMRVLGIVGRDGGYTKKHGDCVIVVPTVNTDHVTPHTEAFQSVILHLLVSHPNVQVSKTKW